MGGSKGEEDGSDVSSFKEKDYELLIKIVKECQRNRAVGKEGRWDQYRALHAGKSSNSNDPAKHPWTLLAQFLESLENEVDIQLMDRMREWQAQRLKAEKLNKSDPWPKTPEQDLVVRCQQHVNYKSFYGFPSYSKNWVCTKRGKSSSVSEPEKLLAIDCEMCLSVGQEREIVRVSVVDRDSKVLLNSLVAPSLEVLDYKTSVTGVSPEELRTVTFSQQDAQKAVLDLVTPGTILVGHGLHHDLKALKIDHERIIDTALLFQFKNLPSLTLGLKDLFKVVLNKGFREGGGFHDSVEDALAPLALVLYELKNGPSPALDPPDVKVDKTELSKLFVHRIPANTSREELESLFLDPKPAQIQTIGWKSPKFGTTFVVFENAEKANMAFKALKGNQDKDALGRAQKTVKFKTEAGNTAEVVVRKMGCHNGQLFGVDSRKGALFSPSQTKEEKKKDKKRGPLVESTGEDLIEGVNGDGSQKKTKKRKSDVLVKEEREAETTPGERDRDTGRGVVGVSGEMGKGQKDKRKGVRTEKTREELEVKGEPDSDVSDRDEHGNVDPEKQSVSKTKESSAKRKRKERRAKEREEQGRQQSVEGERAAKGEGTEREERKLPGPSFREEREEVVREVNGGRGVRENGGGGGGNAGNSFEARLEMECLKKKIEERDAEVAALQRIVAELLKKQYSN